MSKLAELLARTKPSLFLAATVLVITFPLFCEADSRNLFGACMVVALAEFAELVIATFWVWTVFVADPWDNTELTPFLWAKVTVETFAELALTPSLNLLGTWVVVKWAEFAEAVNTVFEATFDVVALADKVEAPSFKLTDTPNPDIGADDMEWWPYICPHNQIVDLFFFLLRL